MLLNIYRVVKGNAVCANGRNNPISQVEIQECYSSNHFLRKKSRVRNATQNI